jgi:adenylate cyclase
MAAAQTRKGAEGDARIEAAFLSERILSWRLAVRVNLAVFAVIVTWVIIENGFPQSFFMLPLITLLAALLAVPYWLLRAGRLQPWHNLLLPVLYAALLTVLTLYPNPLSPFRFPLPIYLRFANEVYFFCLLAGAMFSYSPAGVFWTALVSAIAWSIGHWVILSSPGAYWMSDAELAALTPAQSLRPLADPYWVNVHNWTRDVVAMLVTGGILATFVWRSRLLVYRQVQSERERANLSRYFSASMVDELARSDEPLGPTRSQTVAVLFADLVGFSTLSVDRSPGEVIALLREFHGRMERAVFAHDGTVDKYIGDAVMATFGTPRVRPDDALRALRCAYAMVDSLEQWNRERRGRGEPSIAMGVGIHYGPVVLGDIGGAQRMEFAVIGDTVNVASRLERLTRELTARVVVSNDLVAAVRQSGSELAPELSALAPAGSHRLRGRAGDVELWCRR